MASPPLTITAEQLRDPLFFFSEDERQLLRRCATLRTVDAEVYDAVVRAELPGIKRSFDDLAGESYAERVPGPMARFALRDPLRSRAFQSWWTDGGQAKPASIADPPPALRSFSVRLVDYYAERQQPLERLYHLVAVDRNAAAQEFRKLFAEADAALDLPFCTALIRLLEEQEELLGEQVAVLNEARRRLRARTLWAREQYETVYYLERDSTRSLLDNLLGDDEHRLLQTYAPGGMGKTMFLRATIARRCVSKDIPCARIDFDLESQDVAHSVWWLCLRMAQQLSQQLPRNPFDEFLAQYERRLTPQRPRSGNEAATSPALDPDLPRRVVNSFLEKVEEIDQPFLVIFDTLENLRGKDNDQKALYDLLERLLDGNEAARVILAGRFDLRQPIEGSPAHTETEFNRRFGQRSITVRFQGFSDDEARAYLTEHRKLTDDADDTGQKRIPVLLDKARTPQDGVNPFTLAILADVVRANPQITAAEIAAYPNANLAYLIERVIERIDNEAVRWVVRYGVAPRRLTRQYVERVLLPVFQEVEERPGQLDDTHKDRGVPKDAFGDRGQGGDAGQLWQTLYRYVSDYSWVMTASDAPDALIFHSSVLEPMRELLWEQLEEGRPVLRLLHQHSLAFYTDLTQADPAQAGRWLREALYHKVQSGAADVDDFWFAQITAHPQQTDDLASEALVLAAAADASETLAARSAAIGPRVLAAAAYRLADNLARASSLAERTEQERLQSWLATVERHNPANQPVAPAAGIAWLRARLQQAQDKAGPALETVEAALPLAEQPQTVIDLHLLRGDLLR
ncbi:MAG: ATP-binding protein, partial [Chloroflexi bacterium]|nr:ATP-binding protein [Chloroflexota bacterium]